MKTCVSIVLIFCFCVGYAQIQSVNSGNWDNPTTWQNGIIPGDTDTIEIISGHSVTLGNDASIHTIILDNGSLSIGPHTLSIYGNIIGASRNNVSSNTNSELRILEHDSSDIFIFPTQIESLKKLTLHRNAGAQSYHDLYLDGGVPSDGIVLILNNGVLYMENETVLFLNSKFIQREIPCSDSSHVDGFVQRDVPKNSGVYIFPIGDKGICRPFGVGTQNGNNANISQVRFTYDTPPNNNNVDYSKLPGGIIQYFFWEHKVIYGANPQRRLYYSDDDFPGISSEDLVNSMTLANTDGTSKWDRATTGWTVSDTYKYVEFDNANASNNEFWTLGSILGDISYEEIDLPITLIDFNAIETKYGIEIFWVTGEERNNSLFCLERSTDGNTFEVIYETSGSGNSNLEIVYNFIDETFYSNQLYYRLKQIDTDGTTSYSKTVFIEIKNAITPEIISITPIENSLIFLFDYYESPPAIIKICTVQGTEISNIKLYPLRNTPYTIPIPLCGIILVNISIGDISIQKKYIFQ